MSKKLLLLSLGALSTLALTSCSDVETTIHFYTDDIKGVKKDLLMSAKEQFEKENPGYKVSIDVQGRYTKLKETINTKLSENRQPDLAFCYPDHVAEYLAVKDKEGKSRVIDMKQYIDNDSEFNLEDIRTAYDENLSLRSKGGNEWYLLPFAKSSEAIYFNKQLIKYYNEKNIGAKIKEIGKLDQSQYAGYYNTWTWNELWDIAKKLQDFVSKWKSTDKEEILSAGLGNIYNNLFNADGTKKENAEFFGVSFDSADNTLIQELMKPDSNGKNQFITADGEGAAGKLTFLKSGAAYTKQVLKKYYDNRQSKLFRARINAGKDISTIDTDITNGIAALHVTSTSHTDGMAKYAKEKNVELAMAIRPSDSEHPTVISQGPSIVMFSQDRIKDEAKRNKKHEKTFQFVKLLTSADFSAKYALNVGYMPVRKSSFDTDTMKSFLSDQSKEQLVKDGLEMGQAFVEGRILVYQGNTPTPKPVQVKPVPEVTYTTEATLNTGAKATFEPDPKTVLVYFFSDSFVGSDNVRQSVKAIFEAMVSTTCPSGKELNAWFDELLQKQFEVLSTKVK